MTTRHRVPGVDLLVGLGEYNAPRQCRQCDEPARFYLFNDGEVSVYVCDEHLDDAVRDAGGDPSSIGGDLVNGSV